jgi:uncharacterized protein (UPF0276 family)
MNSKLSATGIGLRREHHHYVKENKPAVNWFEVLIDNYLDIDGIAYQYLENISADYPISFHSVSMSLGTTDPFNIEYFTKLKKLIAHFNPLSISDHVSWSSVNQKYVHDLYPLPFTEEAIKVISNNIKRIQDFFGRQLLIENVSSYFTYSISTMPEWEFINAIAKESDCYILLDINNIFVSCHNHNWNKQDYIAKIDASRVKQYHLGGHHNTGKFLLDNHGAPIIDNVWDLFRESVNTIGAVPALIEWDTGVPDFIVLQQEAMKAQQIIEENKVCCVNYN